MPGAVVSVVARRHGLTPQQLFTWRREARQAAAAPQVFVPAVIAPEPEAQPAAAIPSSRRAKSASPRRRAAGIASGHEDRSALALVRGGDRPARVQQGDRHDGQQDRTDCLGDAAAGERKRYLESEGLEH